MTIVTERIADTDAPILDVFAERWSTRIYDPAAPLDEEAFASALEAARWAASGMNWQPWHFIVGRRGTQTHAKIIETLTGFNQAWAPDAAALVVIVAKLTQPSGEPNPWAVYDTGQAAANLAAQAHASGLYGHQMGGFDHEAVRAAFSLGAEFEPQAVIALGALGDRTAADAAVLARESGPRERRTVAASMLISE